VVRLSVLAQHLPPGAALELLIMGEAGLVGVLFRLGPQQQQQQLVSVGLDLCWVRYGGL
jgi:hypothetical protein